MTDKQTQNEPAAGNMKKDPDDWVTGEEPMTGAQRSYLKTLAQEAGQPFDENLTKADASRRIDELQASTGRHPPGQEPRGDDREMRDGNSGDGGQPARREGPEQAAGPSGGTTPPRP
jgi:Protein of unknown function (DUF3072)